MIPLALYTAKLLTVGERDTLWWSGIWNSFFRKKNYYGQVKALALSFFLWAPVRSESKQRLTEAVVLCSVVVFFGWRANSHTSGEPETGPRAFRCSISHVTWPSGTSAMLGNIPAAFFLLLNSMASWSGRERETGFRTCSSMWVIFPWKRKWCMQRVTTKRIQTVAVDSWMNHPLPLPYVALGYHELG